MYFEWGRGYIVSRLSSLGTEASLVDNKQLFFNPFTKSAKYEHLISTLLCLMPENCRGTGPVDRDLTTYH